MVSGSWTRAVAHAGRPARGLRRVRHESSPRREHQADQPAADAGHRGRRMLSPTSVQCSVQRGWSHRGTRWHAEAQRRARRDATTPRTWHTWALPGAAWHDVAHPAVTFRVPHRPASFEAIRGGLGPAGIAVQSGGCAANQPRHDTRPMAARARHGMPHRWCSTLRRRNCGDVACRCSSTSWIELASCPCKRSTPPGRAS